MPYVLISSTGFFNATSMGAEGERKIVTALITEINKNN